MKKITLRPLAVLAAALLLVSCTLPGEQKQDDDFLPGSYDTQPAQADTEIINYVWVLEPSISAENIIVFDGSQVDPDAPDYSDMYTRVAVIARSGVYGLIDYEGNILVEPNYKYYFVAPNGQVVLYNNLDEKGEEREYCTLDEDGKVIDTYSGSETSRIKYYYDDENKSIYCAKESEDWYVRKYEDKKTVVAVKADVLDNGMSIEVVDPEPGTERYGLVNQDGVVLDFEYDAFYGPTYIGAGKTGIALKKNDKWGYVDSKGGQLLDFNCDEVFSSYNGELSDDPNVSHPYLYSEDFLAVSINYSFGYYNMDGKCVVKTNEFSQARPVHHGKAWVNTGTLWGVIRFGEEEEEETTTTTTTKSATAWSGWNSSPDSSSYAETYYTDDQPPISYTQPPVYNDSGTDTGENPYTDLPVDTDPYTDTDVPETPDPGQDTEEPYTDTDPVEPVDPVEPAVPDDGGGQEEVYY